MTLLPPASTYLLTVAGAVHVGARLRRVTLAGEGLAELAALPGQDLVVHLTDEHGSGVRRRYTIRHLDRARRRVDLDVVLHGDGPGARWGAEAEPGTTVEVFGPRGKVVLAAARWQLFAGDESALPAIAEMASALPADTEVTALVEIQDADDEQPVAAIANLQVRWLHRGTTPPGTSDLLERALSDLDIPDADRHAYLFAESRVVRRLRDVLGARGLRADEISAKGYWNMGRATAD